MKKLIRFFIIGVLFLSCAGCFNNDTMDNIKIYTSTYPIKYVTERLYSNHSTIKSIYPSDTEIKDYKLTKTLIKEYSDNDLFIFNGLSNEKNYLNDMVKYNDNLKIIDVTSNMEYENAIEDLWLNPNSLLTIANNIKEGFSEYITSTYLVDEIKENYQDLKLDLTTLDAKYYSTVSKANNKTIVVTDDAFKFLEKYGLNVISLDKDTAENKDIVEAKDFFNHNKYIYIKYKEEVNDEVKSLINEYNLEQVSLYTMTNLIDIDTTKTDYLNLMYQNLENLKTSLYN